MERDAVTKSPTGRKASVERKVGECYQWNAIGQCSRGDMIEHLEKCDQRQEGQASSLAPKAKAQTDGKKTSKGSGRRGKSFWNKKPNSVPTFLWDKVYELVMYLLAPSLVSQSQV